MEAEPGRSFRDRRKYIPVGFEKNVLFFTIPKGPPRLCLQVTIIRTDAAARDKSDPSFHWEFEHECLDCSARAPRD